MADLRKGYWVHLLPTERPDGSLTIALIARRTYKIAADSLEIVALEDADQPPFLEEDRCDEGKPDKAPPTVEVEFVPEKPKVDVLVIGKALAPGGKAVAEFDVGVTLGTRTETLRILGPRKAVWQPPKKINEKLVAQLPTFTKPEPIKELALSYLQAYGGKTWWIQDETDLRMAAKVNAVMDEEQAEKKAKQAAVKVEKEKKAAVAAKEQQIKDVFAKKDAAAKAKDEKLKLGDGSEGFDEDGVRMWGTSASKDGTAVISLEEFENQQLAEMAAQMRIDQDSAAAKAADEAKKKLRRNAAGDFIEVDDGAALLSDEQLAKELEGDRKVAEQEAALAAKEAKKRAREQVENSGGTRVFDLEDMPEDHEDDKWDSSLKGQLEEKDSAGKKAREKEALERRKREDEALAKYPQLTCPTNPYGKGFCVCNQREVLQRLELPQIEHPAMLLTPKDLVRDLIKLEEVPVPAGFGCFPRFARPRVQWFGPPQSALSKFDAMRDEQKRALDLADEDQVRQLREIDKMGKPLPLRPPFFNCAPTNMQWHELRGDEAITLHNMTKEGTLYFKLPGKVLTGELDRGNGIERKDLRLDTVVLDVEARLVTLVWRTQFALKSWLEIESYPHMIGWVLDLDVQAKRDLEWAERLKQAQGEGTAVLDLNAMPIEHEEYLPPSQPDARERAADGALELPKEGSYIQASEDDQWVKDAAAGVRDLDGEDKKRKAEAEYQAKKKAALEALAKVEKEDEERRKEIVDAIAAGQPVPPKGGAPDGKKPKPKK